MLAHVSPNLSSSHMLGGGRMPDYLPCAPDSGNDRPITVISPNETTLVASIPSHTPGILSGSWGPNSLQWQVADI